MKKIIQNKFGSLKNSCIFTSDLSQSNLPCFHLARYVALLTSLKMVHSYNKWHAICIINNITIKYK